MGRTDKATQLVQIPAQLVGFNPKQDRSWKLAFETRELPSEQVKLLADNFQGEGWLVWKANSEVTQDEVPEGNAEPGTKSASRRLRDRLFILYKQKDIRVDFESFYRTSMERFIEQVDEKLEPEDK